MPTPVYELYAADAEWRLSQGGDFDVNLTSSCHLRFTNLAVRLRCTDCRAETHVRQGNFGPEWVTNGNCMAKKGSWIFIGRATRAGERPLRSRHPAAPATNGCLS